MRSQSLVNWIRCRWSLDRAKDFFRRDGCCTIPSPAFFEDERRKEKKMRPLKESLIKGAQTPFVSSLFSFAATSDVQA